MLSWLNVSTNGNENLMKYGEKGEFASFVYNTTIREYHYMEKRKRHQITGVGKEIKTGVGISHMARRTLSR